MEKKYAAPTTYGASKFEIMTDELHAKKVAVVETLEDAVLMSTAPELLEKLKALVGLAKYRGGHLDEYKAAITDADAIIAKAEGKA